MYYVLYLEIIFDSVHQFSSYWYDLFTKGAVPLVALVYFNAHTIHKIRASAKFDKGNRHAGGGGAANANARRTVVESASDPVQASKEGGGEGRRKTRKTVSLLVKKRQTAPRQEEGDKVGSIQLQGLLEDGKGEGGVEGGAGGGGERRGEGGGEDKIVASPTKEGDAVDSRIASLKRWRTVKTYVQQNGTSGGGNSDSVFRRRREKSTLILVLIVVFFVLCHCYRLALKLYEFANPEANTADRNARCAAKGRFHIPVHFFVLLYMHHLVLALNSSVNFLIYCCVGKDFRNRLAAMFRFS